MVERHDSVVTLILLIMVVDIVGNILGILKSV